MAWRWRGWAGRGCSNGHSLPVAGHVSVTIPEGAEAAAGSGVVPRAGTLVRTATMARTSRDSAVSVSWALLLLTLPLLLLLLLPA